MNTSKAFEPEMIINPNTRQIHVPRELYNIAVRLDDNAEVVKLRIPRYFDGCDFADKICRIVYNNALGERGAYNVEERVISDDNILISWYITNHVTKKEGKIYFTVSFSTDVDNRGLSYYFSTLPTELNVLPGLSDGNINDGEDIDISVINGLIADSHNHPNKDILDAINTDVLDKINNSTHIHDNKNILDSITNETIDRINTAYNHTSDSAKHLPSGGTTGQVVGINNDGNIAWIPNDGNNTQLNDYNTFTNKPSINGVELEGNKTSTDLGITIPTVPTNVSEFNNDAQYITNSQLTNSLARKVDKEAGKVLSTNDYTDEDKNKLSTTPEFIFSTTIPTELSNNVVCFVYEEAN